VRKRFLLFSSVLTCACVLFAADDARVIATVNGESITSKQLDEAVKKQIESIEERVRQLRQGALNKLIDNLLIEQAAKAEEIDIDAYLHKKVESVSVPAAEVDQAYDRSRDQFPGVLPAEAKYRIRRTLEDNRRSAALNDLLNNLRRQGRVTNHLMEDRLALLDFVAQEGPSIGNPNALVTIVEFSDFECPYCRSAQADIKRVLERWPDQVRLVFRHFPLEQHPNALPAARAAVCADRQGRFWLLHDRIFAATGSLGGAQLRLAATEAGLNSMEFEACMRGEEALERVRKDILLGRTVGVSGTPAFFVNRQPLESAAELAAAVERILGGAQ
jgi:protein-disulfide isomerase/Skp family chaperone for outer membrane proteins